MNYKKYEMLNLINSKKKNWTAVELHKELIERDFEFNVKEYRKQISSVSCMLSDLVEEGKVRRVCRGVYGPLL